MATSWLSLQSILGIKWRQTFAFALFGQVVGEKQASLDVLIGAPWETKRLTSSMLILRDTRAALCNIYLQSSCPHWCPLGNQEALPVQCLSYVIHTSSDVQYLFPIYTRFTWLDRQDAPAAAVRHRTKNDLSTVQQWKMTERTKSDDRRGAPTVIMLCPAYIPIPLMKLV